MIRAQIVLATFNGGKFLKEQMQSLVRQSEQNWICFIRDDGSQDETMEVVRDFSRRDSRFKIIADEWNHLGPCQSFGKLLEHCSVEAPIFFCDQDDYWHPEKLRIFLSGFSDRLESDGPLVVASDLALTDSHLKLRSPSMMSTLGYQPSSIKFENLLGQNIFPGCALAFHPSLLRQALPIPTEVPMHDWWVALLASANGSIKFIPEALVLYRQHERQASGGSGSANLATKTYRAFFASNKNLAALTKMRFLLWKNLAARLEIFGARKNFSNDFSRWFEVTPSLGRMGALLAVLKAKIRLQGVLRNLLFAAGIFLYFGEWNKLTRKNS